MDDVRYCELVFLQHLAKGSPQFEFFRGHPDQPSIVGLSHNLYEDMVVALLEDLYIRFQDQDKRLLVSRLRGEVSPSYAHFPTNLQGYQWGNPREALHDVLSHGNLYKLVITYRGLRRIEELRELLRRDRILERFGVLLDLRYLHADLEDALQRPAETPVSILYADLDKFKAINDGFGHDAGDVVLKKYLEVVRDNLGSFGKAYRGTGDEVVVLVPGQGHERAVELAETIRKNVEAMVCEYQGRRLPSVTTSIGVCSTPPEARTLEIETVADTRNRDAKTAGKNCMISASNKKQKRIK